MLAATQRPDRCIHLLRPGRLVRVRAGASDWGWGVVVSVLHTPPRADGAPPPPDNVLTDSCAMTDLNVLILRCFSTVGIAIRASALFGSRR